jgi:hypothetical protein
MRENFTKPARAMSLLLPALVALLLQASVMARNGKRVAVGRAVGKIALDGVLDEADWAQAPSLGEIRQREPKQETDATERTEVKLLADKDNLYIGVACYDSEPEKVVGTQMARDAELEIDDSVAILLDTFHDRRNAFYFATNPAGALVDGLIVENQRGINFNWNAIWNVRVKRNAQARNYFVGRFKRNLFKQSFIGGIYTEGDPLNKKSGRTLGADMRLATANFLGGKRNFAVDAYAVKTLRAGLTGDDTSFGVIASHPNDRWWGYADYRHVGRDFSPALGFVQRRAIDKFSYRTEFNPRPKKFLNVRQMFNEFQFTAYRRNDVGKVESWRLFTAPINWEFNSGDRVELNWVPTFERLFAPFEIADGVTLPAGDYRFTRYRAEVETAPKRPWQAFVTWWFGSYFSGQADETSAQLLFKFAPHFQAGVTAEQTFARLPQGNFVARVWALRADYAFSPFFTVANFIRRSICDYTYCTRCSFSLPHHS